jgi:sulfatase maturation enzyme AslB (radical SAM superfamily)
MTLSGQLPSTPREKQSQPGAADAVGTTGTIADSQGFGDLKPIAPGRPKWVQIESTDRCNTRCRHCSHYHYTFGTDMSEAVTHKAIALVDGAEAIVPQVNGEPLIAKSFYTILEACERSGVRVGFATNAILLGDEALVRRLVRAPVDLMVSIDGARAETYHFVRPLQDWDRLLEALALVQRCRQEAGPEVPRVTGLHLRGDEGHVWRPPGPGPHGASVRRSDHPRSAALG